MMKIYVNGHFVDRNQAKVSVFDRGYLYGDGVFEGIRAYQGRIFELDAHIKRLYQSAHAILLDIPLQPEAMRAVILTACQINNITNGYIRVNVSRGEGDLSIDPDKCGPASVVVIADTIQLYPPKLYETGMAIMTVPTRRNHHEALNPQIKSMNYLNNILAKLEANHAGYNEVLMLNQEGYVVEGTADNVFIVRDGQLLTPPTFGGALNGITRNVVIQLARDRGWQVQETPFTRFDLYTAEECFLTGTACELIPVIACDGRTIGTGKPGPLTARILADFRKMAANSGVSIPASDQDAPGDDQHGPRKK